MLNRRVYSKLCHVGNGTWIPVRWQYFLDASHGYQNHELPLLASFSENSHVCQIVRVAAFVITGQGLKKAYDELAELFQKARILHG